MLQTTLDPKEIAWLAQSLDQQAPDAHQRALDLPEHENVRGAAYYQSNLSLH